ncbi:primosomal protein N' [Marichromatium bheemlicum]|uniref:Replication restart protein PriA n=1 Tax=Marichromatium bheemlicum TaxID=365339 RepID=A0ABX1I5V3_9GAMM|nr:primosomal protein N' [Marichromatium bheemlicum]NKN32947.1 primosomal protein N' [Marichromatium bheemlicum]
MNAIGVARVALAGPVDALFDYLPAATGDPLPGSRVLVPFGHSRRVGILVEHAAECACDPAALKRIERVLDPRPLFAPADLALLRWAARYYHHPLGDALFTALPVRLRGSGRLLGAEVGGVRLTAAGAALAPAELARAPRQQALLERLAKAPQGVALQVLEQELAGVASALRALRAKGLAESCRVAPARAAVSPPAPAVVPTLNPEQAAALAAVNAARGGFQPFLLDGITGSGKTEVYIRAIAEVVAAGGQALVMVPEIGLTPQLRERLRTRLPGPLAVLHSALAAGERERAWHQAASGEAPVVLGTRSAVFVPLPRLALIVVDEEHDPSLKQQEGFRYSARDLAVRRAQLVGCPVVLGTATPALETLHNVAVGRYHRLALPRRAGGARPPTINLLDIRNQPLRAGLSPVLRERMHAALAAGGQVLLLLNRRGYAPVLTCHSCGWVGACVDCDARMTLHLTEQRLWCHHCGRVEPVPRDCPQCGGPDLRMLGRGTERLEEGLAELFPEVRIARIDRDSTRRKGELTRLLAAVHRGEVQILLGTQMLAKGHDFPGVTLAGVIDLDHALYASDFRAPERTAQLIVQVAGRAGRAERAGEVVLQTRHPEHPLLQSLLREGYAGFARAALAEREAAQLPPFTYLALLRAEAPEQAVAHAFLAAARDLAEPLCDPGVELLGPVPAPLARRAGRHRAQLLVQSAARPALQQLLAQWTPALRGLRRRQGVRWSLDVDPQEMV